MKATFVIPKSEVASYCMVSKCGHDLLASQVQTIRDQIGLIKCFTASALERDYSKIVFKNEWDTRSS
jgi:hypothetical protein